MMGFRLCFPPTPNSLCMTACLRKAWSRILKQDLPLMMNTILPILPILSRPRRRFSLLSNSRNHHFLYLAKEKASRMVKTGWCMSLGGQTSSCNLLAGTRLQLRLKTFTTNHTASQACSLYNPIAVHNRLLPLPFIKCTPAV